VAAFEPARGPGWSVARGCRIGTGPAWPSDQVAIDGRRSSSTRKRAGAAETLGFHLGVAGAHRSAARWRGKLAAVAEAPSGRGSSVVKRE
jgi:hypothetical protein